jgi:glycosyltransferase involved in cell wall biosynthesis
MVLRRWYSRRILKRCGDIWPVLESAGRKPEGWPGWPDGKQFAFLLTHDVESQEGVDRVRQLAELEMSLGFRSSFNFIPKGSYRLTPQLREWLVTNGFEVGVHDLYHDGKLYRSREVFRRCHAKEINRCLQAWNAVGFRSAFMHNQLNWLHDLEIQYDASTFDTDPFEPQPDEAGTIFPFWVPAPAPSERREERGEGAPDARGQRTEGGRQCVAQGQSSDLPGSQILAPGSDARPTSDLHSPVASGKAGYLELPYTLPQDSTLFLLLGKRDPEIWVQKLGWIAEQGGLALVNLHPDYICFDGERPSAFTYPVEYYRRFLRHARQRYAGSFWQPLPKDLAAYMAHHRPQPCPKPKRVCMVTYSHFLSDARVRRYAAALAGRGDHVDVLALQPSREAPKMETVGNVHLFCVQSRLGKKEKSPVGFLLPLLRFLTASSFWITRRHARQPYDVLHIHNIPDFLVFAAWYPRLRGARVILDIHDIVPEFFTSKFARKADSLSVRALLLMERWSARFAHHVIIANDLWREKYATRTGTESRCTVFINNVNTDIFQPTLRRGGSDVWPLVMFPGGLQWHQGLDLAIRAFPGVVAVFPKAEFHIYGEGAMKSEWMALAASLGLADRVKFFTEITVREIARKMAEADLGVVPKRADSFGNEAYSTKIMEFMALGVPVVISSTRVDRHYFDDSIVKFFESGHVDALAAAMIEVLQNREETRERVARASAYATAHNWETRKHDYLKLVDDLCTR